MPQKISLKQLASQEMQHSPVDYNKKKIKQVARAKKLNVMEEHPADDKFIECALAAGAEYIVSGDKYLLKIANCKKIQTFTVNEFLRNL